MLELKWPWCFGCFLLLVSPACAQSPAQEFEVGVEAARSIEVWLGAQHPRYSVSPDELIASGDPDLIINCRQFCGQQVRFLSPLFEGETQVHQGCVDGSVYFIRMMFIDEGGNIIGDLSVSSGITINDEAATLYIFNGSCYLTFHDVALATGVPQENLAKLIIVE